MKEQWEQECANLRAELAALQKELHAVETKQAGANVGADSFSRWRLSKSMMMILLPVVTLLASGGVLYGAMEALFINKDGNVGIGTTDPGPNKLKVQGGNTHLDGNLTVGNVMNFSPARHGQMLNLYETYNGIGVQRNTTYFRTFGNFAWFERGSHDEGEMQAGGKDGTVQMVIKSGGKVGIGTTEPDPESKLDVRGKTLVQSLSFTDEKSGKPYLHNWIGMTSDIDTAKTKWLHIGGITDQGKRRIALFADTTRVSGQLDVVGAINGEKPPLVFEVGQKSDTQNWHHVEQDIGALCGDADGCTMKFFLRHSLTDEVRTISEQIYIEQPDKSNNKTAGLSGFTRQGAGEESTFVLQTPAQVELVPHPWNWIWVLNYSHENVSGGRRSKAFEGYRVQFMTHHHITATVIIYDR